jgi:glycosyltransferase involved in cell wall biosynthesis
VCALKISEKPFLVACIAAYNEEKTIASVLVKAMKHVDKVIVCDDGSTDMTGEIASRLGAEVIRHEKNRGKGAALKTMFTYVKQLNPDVVITLDADGQHDPDEIPRLLKPIIGGEAEMVIGSRYVEGSKTDMPLYRRIGLKLIDFTGKRSYGGAVKDAQSGFRAFTSRILDSMLECEAKGYGVETEQLVLAVKGGFKVMEVPITVKYKGLEKTSKKNPVAHGAEIIGLVLRIIVEERPLLFFGVPAALLLMLGLASGVYLLWYFNETRYFSIPVALITLGALFTGITLFITSLILYAISRLKGKR